MNREGRFSKVSKVDAQSSTCEPCGFPSESGKWQVISSYFSVSSCRQEHLVKIQATTCQRTCAVTGQDYAIRIALRCSRLLKLQEVNLKSREQNPTMMSRAALFFNIQHDCFKVRMQRTAIVHSCRSCMCFDLCWSFLSYSPLHFRAPSPIPIACTPGGSGRNCSCTATGASWLTCLQCTHATHDKGSDKSNE